MAPLSTIKELGTASNTFWTALFTFCAGALVGSWPLAMEALSDMGEGSAPDQEALYQLIVFIGAIPMFILSGVLSFRRRDKFDKKIRDLEAGKRFMWDETTNKTTPIPDEPVEPEKPWWQRAFDYVTKRN